ncbi:hypothetical protein MIND_00561000 [Mycena indigotica]|uniref:Uncharacterized protein n=1 Tax=Mycena indigotica TaxID=2126181 RepID=A0A8H6SZJ3_9AGAR|nr:uncharacterized protein MIND_00561000 [Mycena indigotica]KAF7307657.1 hypothetical protein MIND_00561000 [Mycena indigotica]
MGDSEHSLRVNNYPCLLPLLPTLKQPSTTSSPSLLRSAVGGPRNSSLPFRPPAAVVTVKSDNATATSCCSLFSLTRRCCPVNPGVKNLILLATHRVFRYQGSARQSRLDKRLPFCSIDCNGSPNSLYAFERASKRSKTMSKHRAYHLSHPLPLSPPIHTHSMAASQKGSHVRDVPAKDVEVSRGTRGLRVY